MRTTIKARTLLLTLLLLLLSGPLAGRSFAQTSNGGGVPPANTLNPFGVNLLLDTEVEAVKVERTIFLAADANMGWIKQEFPWQDIEINAKGDFNDTRGGGSKSAWDKYDRIVGYAEQYKLNVVARLDKAPQWAGGVPGNAAAYYDFIEAFIKHYKGRIKYIQVWNEPNLSAEWLNGQVPDPAAYTSYLRGAYQRIKQLDPSIIVLSAPMAATTEPEGSVRGMNELTYWQGMYKAGAKDAFDVASANAYGLADAPDVAPDAGKLNFRRVELLHQVMENNGDGNKQIWFNEYGWNANPGPPKLSQEQTDYYRQVTPEQQAQYTVDGIKYARQNWPWAGVFFIWYLRQDGQRIADNDAQFYFALVNPDFSINPVYGAVKRAAEQFKANAAAPATPVPATFAPTPTGAPLPTSTSGSGGGILEPTVTNAPPAASSPTSPAAAIPSIVAGATATSTAAPASGNADSGNNGLVLIILVVVAAVALVGGVAFFLRGGGGNAGSNGGNARL